MAAPSHQLALVTSLTVTDMPFSLKLVAMTV